MEIICNIQEKSGLIRSAIKKNGHLAQHHYGLYLNYGREGENNIYLDFGRNKGILAYRKKDIWRILTEPLAPTKQKKDLLILAIEQIFRQSARKIILEDITPGLRKELIASSKKKNWRVSPINYSLVWPILDLENWNGGGKQWKRLRNSFNKFFKDNQIEIKTAAELESQELKKLILKWKKQRRDTDRVHLAPYLLFAQSGFGGFDVTRIFVCDNRPVSIAAGWLIPNSDRVYYSCVGIYDYDYKNIGEAAYWDELLELRKNGYKKVDLGGSEGGLLAFKNKFHPQSEYLTSTFSILRK